MNHNNSEIPCEICNSNVSFSNYTEHVEYCFIVSASQNYLQHTIRSTMNQQQQPQPIMQTIFQLNSLLDDHDNDNGNNNEEEQDSSSTQIILNSAMFSVDNSNMFIPLSHSASDILNILPMLLGEIVPNSYEMNLQLQELTGGDVMVPVKQKSGAYLVMEQDELNHLSLTNELACAICLENPVALKVVKTVCNHIYCKECIDKWFEMNSKCPICKHDFNSVDNDSTDEI